MHFAVYFADILVIMQKNILFLQIYLYSPLLQKFNLEIRFRKKKQDHKNLASVKYTNNLILFFA